LQRNRIDDLCVWPTVGFMQEIELKQTTELAPLLCQRCGRQLRLIGIESHPDQDRSDLLTYWCARCDDYETRDAAGEIVFKQMSARQNEERVLEAIPKHPVWVQVGPAAFKTQAEAQKQIKTVCVEKR
jgi:hypothetical protein